MSRDPVDRETAARNLVDLLRPLFANDLGPPAAASGHKEILSAIQALASTLVPDRPLFAAFHDGQVHEPLGGGSYAFQADIIGPMLLALTNDENHERGNSPSGRHMGFPSRPVVIHAGAQPNNSPHVGTLVVFCYAFAFARGMRDRMLAMVASTGTKGETLPPVSVQITLVDTAPVKNWGVEMDGLEYQRSYRDIHGALNTHLAEYEEAFRLLSSWSGIPFVMAYQRDLFSQPMMPSILQYIVSHHDLLGRQLSPKFGTLALRSPCPVQGCALAEKHGRRNDYDGEAATITFYCPHHGPHTLCISDPVAVARLEANTPARNLIRSMSHMLDTGTHHVRITGADYAGTYQEMFLYRPLAAWSAATGLGAGRTPHILYAPLVVDWSGAKLSKSLYVREGGYDAMKMLGTDGLCSFARLKSQFGDEGSRGLGRIWREVQGWLENPRKLFRSFSLEYMQRVVLEEREWEADC